jgi:hypothetical protein
MVSALLLSLPDSRFSMAGDPYAVPVISANRIPPGTGIFYSRRIAVVY